VGNYRLTRRAERDLFDLFVYGLERFGATQSAAYQEIWRDASLSSPRTP
jgi:plasmid stabilization system protein ParE